VDAEEGLVFMQEMLELAKSQGPDTLPKAVMYTSQGTRFTLNAGPAHFGKQLRGKDKVHLLCQKVLIETQDFNFFFFL
jgi:hypothetical protein